MIAAWIGDKDLAFEQLATTVRLPDSLSYGELKRNPFWHPLRGDPRFEKLLEESKKPVAMQQAPRAPEFLRGSLYRGTPRGCVKDLAQSTALVHSGHDVVRITRLWVKLYAR